MESPNQIEVGQLYEVPCIMTNLGQTIPVVLPSHTDGPRLCFNDVGEHYHVDFRFCDLWLTNNKAAWLKAETVKLFSLRLRALRTYFNSVEFSGESNFFFVSRWYTYFGDIKIKNGRCAHHDTQLFNTCGTCPAHGLRWNLNSGSLMEFKLPFYMELANNAVPNSGNPRGMMQDRFCEIDIPERGFQSDGTVIMVDSNGKRYGEMTQQIRAYFYRGREKIRFNADKICSLLSEEINRA
jgi:hypothetical protein